MLIHSHLKTFLKLKFAELLSSNEYSAAFEKLVTGMQPKPPDRGLIVQGIEYLIGI